MNNKIINCQAIKNNLLEEIKINLKNKTFTIACIYFTNDENSISYLKQIKSQAKELNVVIKEYICNEYTNESEILHIIHILNNDNTIHGIVFLNPNTYKFNYEKINTNIINSKNIDDFNIPNTVYAILEILKYIKNKKENLIAILGRGELVGMPLYNFLQKNGYNVIQCHSKTKNKKAIISKADIVISAIGKANLIKKEYLKENAIVIDVGTSYKNNKVCGDIDLYDVIDKVKLITKTPGGVGLITTTYLFKNLVNKNKKPSSK